MLLEEYSGLLVTTLMDTMDCMELKHWQESMLVMELDITPSLDHVLQALLTLPVPLM